jgi:hypothetical protein
MNQPSTSSVGGSEFSAENMDRFFGRLDEKVRQSPREAVLIAFLAGALLQVFAVRHLVLTVARVILWLATPVLFVFTALRLFQIGNTDGGLGRFFGFKR